MHKFIKKPMNKQHFFPVIMSRDHPSKDSHDSYISKIKIAVLQPFVYSKKPNRRYETHLLKKNGQKEEMPHENEASIDGASELHPRKHRLRHHLRQGYLLPSDNDQVMSSRLQELSKNKWCF